MNTKKFEYICQLILTVSTIREIIEIISSEQLSYSDSESDDCSVDPGIEFTLEECYALYYDRYENKDDTQYDLYENTDHTEYDLSENTDDTQYDLYENKDYTEYNTILDLRNPILFEAFIHAMQRFGDLDVPRISFGMWKDLYDQSDFVLTTNLFERILNNQIQLLPLRWRNQRTSTQYSIFIDPKKALKGLPKDHGLPYAGCPFKSVKEIIKNYEFHTILISSKMLEGWNKGRMISYFSQYVSDNLSESDNLSSFDLLKVLNKIW